MAKHDPLDPNISLEELTEQANAGHPVACYGMAKLSEQKRELKEAVDWLNKSAEAGFPPAKYELGMWHLLGHNVEHDISRAQDLIGAAAGDKFPDAQRLLGVLYLLGLVPGGGWPEAVDNLIAAAKQVDPHALRQIGFFMRTRKGDKKISDLFLKVAAAMNEQISLQLAGKQEGIDPDKEIPQQGDDKFWNKIREFLHSFGDEKASDGEELAGEPVIRRFKGVLSADECLYLREMARPSLTENVQLLGGNPEDPSYQELQSNRVMVFYPIVQDLVIVLLFRRLMKHAGMGQDFAELPIVQNTREGEQFKLHADYMDPENPQQAYSIQQSGQRVKSLFCYLNDDYEGGETEFPEAGLKFKGKAGDVLVIDNVNSIGLPEEKSKHAGLPVAKGEKWLATLWFRDKKLA